MHGADRSDDHLVHDLGRPVHHRDHRDHRGAGRRGRHRDHRGADRNQDVRQDHQGADHQDHRGAGHRGLV